MALPDLKKLKLPDEPGVYFFLGSPTRATPEASTRRERSGGGIGPKKEILYIGKATSLRDRVRSYFSKDLLESRGPRLVTAIKETKTVKWETTDSVLEALILEANQIKKHQPRYNAREKDNKSFNYVAITNEEFPRVLLIRGRELEAQNFKFKTLYGPFPQGGQLKEALKIIQKIFPFYDTKKPVSEYKTQKEQKHIKFNQEIGVYPPSQTKGEYRKTIQNIKLLFEGKKKPLLRKLEAEMRIFAKKQEFEKAQVVKRQTFALQHIQDIRLIKDELKEPGGDFRIEAYDIAHTSGIEMVGVMTVVENGEAKKSDYRKFKINTLSGVNDVGALKEVLERRLTHPEWPLPKLIVMDGGKAQRNVAERVLDEAGLSIPVVSVVKDEKHRPREILGDRILRSKYEKAIVLANSEAHRFAISWHRKRRGQRN
ncbi:MAG: UvrB/UvrC motif-containing protein [Candidatus Paceibacterota bacterium]